MASENWSRALMSVGESLGDFAGMKMEQEQAEADRIHQESLTRLRGQIDRDIRRESDKREFEFRESQADREYDFRADEGKKDRQWRSGEARKDRDLTTRRLDDAERRSVEAAAIGQLQEINDRIVSLRDQALEMRNENLGKIEPEVKQAIDAEIAQLLYERTLIRHQMIEQLAGMGDPRYADMTLEDRLTQAGYSPRQIEIFKQDAARQEGRGKEPAAAPSNNAEDVIQRPPRYRSRPSRAEKAESASHGKNLFAPDMFEPWHDRSAVRDQLMRWAQG